MPIVFGSRRRLQAPRAAHETVDSRGAAPPPDAARSFRPATEFAWPKLSSTSEPPRPARQSRPFSRRSAGLAVRAAARCCRGFPLRNPCSENHFSRVRPARRSLPLRWRSPPTASPVKPRIPFRRRTLRLPIQPPPARRLLTLPPAPKSEEEQEQALLHAPVVQSLARILHLNLDTTVFLLARH